MRRTRPLAASLLLLCSPCPAAAALVTVSFSGVVSGYGSFIPPPEYAGSMAPGDPVFGTFRYDTNAYDSYGLDPHRSESTSSLNYLEATLGSVHVVPDATNPVDPSTWLQILDDFPYDLLGGAPIDRFGVFNRASAASSPVPIEQLHLQLFLTDPSHSVFASDAIPTTLPALSAFAPPPPQFPQVQGQLTTESGAPIQVFVNFSITEWHVVPEAAASPAAAASICVLLLLARGTIPARGYLR